MHSLPDSLPQHHSLVVLVFESSFLPAQIPAVVFITAASGGSGGHHTFSLTSLTGSSPRSSPLSLSPGVISLLVSELWMMLMLAARRCQAALSSPVRDKDRLREGRVLPRRPRPSREGSQSSSQRLHNTQGRHHHQMSQHSVCEQS